MSLLKSDDFIADVEQQFEWYVVHASWEVAERYSAAVEVTCRLLERHPQLGPSGDFKHPRLREWRFFVVFRPLNKHVLFYEPASDDVIMRRAMQGHRDLPRRLLEPPAAP